MPENQNNPFQGKRIALVHDWLNGMRGGEKCLEVLCEIFPDATLFTLIHEQGRLSEKIEKMKISTSFIQKLPLGVSHYRHYLPIMPKAIETFDLSEFDLIVVGPRYSGYVFRDSEPLGISRAQLAKVPLVVLQNKMYESHGEYTGDVRSKLQWAANLGAAAAFTWIGATAAHNFSRRSGVPHHWMPFGVNQQLYGSFAGNFSHQVCKPRKSCHKYCSTTLTVLHNPK